MDMRTYLAELIERMTLEERGVNSADSISWHAHREAEQLHDLSLVGELANFIELNPTPQKRAAAYFIIGSIGKNCEATECARILIGFAGTEKDKYALSSLLGRLADIPKSEQTNLEPLFALLTDKRWLVRHAAIQSLINVSSPEPEDRLLELLVSTSDAQDVIYCQATLNRIGTPKALDVLRSNITSRKQDVKLSAVAAIESIESRNTAPEAIAK